MTTKISKQKIMESNNTTSPSQTMGLSKSFKDYVFLTQFVLEVERRNNLPTIKHKNPTKTASQPVKRNSKQKPKPNEVSPLIRSNTKNQPEVKPIIRK